MFLDRLGSAAGTFSSSRQPAAPELRLPFRTVRRRKVCVVQATSSLAEPSIMTGSERRDSRKRQASPRKEESLPVYVSLERDVLTSSGSLAYEEALRVGLKAMRLLGITGIQVEIYWGLVELSPGQYIWEGYTELMQIILEMGLSVRVSLCFNSCESVSMPEWIRELGKSNPNIWYTDKQGVCSEECLTLGVDDLPVLHGRSALEAYRDFMASFREEYANWLDGNYISHVLIGMGPNAELKYPAHPFDGTGRWEYPGTGEFQCYDKFMMGSLKSCAEQVKQPSWGLGGPHNACDYNEWPHQSGFFSQGGNWSSPYGKFFLQWYSEMLALHGCKVMRAAAEVFKGVPVQLNARIPGCHWWFNTASHGAELTAGYYNTGQRDGYLPVFKPFASLSSGIHLSMAEARGMDKPAGHCSDPEHLLLGQRTVASALHMPVTLENTEVRFDEAALARMETVLFEPVTHLGVEVAAARSLLVNRMSDLMFEPYNWQRFKHFIRKIKDRAERSSLDPAKLGMEDDGEGRSVNSSR